MSKYCARASTENMDLNFLKKVKQEALKASVGFGYSSRDKYLYSPKIGDFYHFPSDNLTILVVYMVPELEGYWDCEGAAHWSDCPYLSEEKQEKYFPRKPECSYGTDCLAQKRESFTIVYQIQKDGFERVNHHAAGDFESEYCDSSENIKDYIISEQDVLNLI